MIVGAGVVILSGAWAFIEGHVVAPSWGRFLPAAAAGCLLIARPGGGGAGWARAATILGLHAGCGLLLPGLLASSHVIPAAAPFAAGCLRLLGRTAGVDTAGSLVTETASGATAVALTWEGAAAGALLRCACGFLVIRGLRGIGCAAAWIVAWGFLRMLLLAVMRAEGVPEAWLREPAILCASLLPLATLGRAAAPAPADRSSRAGSLIALTLGLTAGMGAGFWWFFAPPGARAAGRVILDEGRSGWEPASGPFGPDRFGQRTLYNYALWRRWIEAHYRLRVMDRTPEQEDLAAADVVIVKTPTRPYDDDAIARYERFVREGGGLLLIGDHTNLFGMTSVLNPLAAPYGGAFRADATFPLDHTARDLLRPGPLRHPILRGIRVYPFETSCSIDPPRGADLFMIGRRLGAEPADYGHVNFFGNIALDPADPYGLFVQGAVVDHGRGRVAMFTDSTNFSNFSMLWPGRRRLTLNLIDWLNRRADAADRLPGLVLLLIGTVACVGAVRAAAVSGRAARACGVWGGVAGVAAGGWIAAAAGASLAGAVSPREAIPRALFDAAISGLDMEDASPVFGADEPSWRAFNAFFIDTARTGLWPEIMTDTGDTVGAKIWIAVNPRRAMDAVHRRALDRFLAAGGRFLILDSVLNEGSTTASILAPFGLAPRVTLGSDGSGARVPVLEAAAPEGWAVGSHAAGLRWWSRRVGAGRVVYAHDAALLSDRGFGGVYVTPDADQDARHRAQMRLIEETMAE